MASLNVQGGDLRGWLETMQELGEVRVLEGADRDAEIGTITEIIYNRKDAPTVLFDCIPGFPKGYRVLVNTLGSTRRLASTLGLAPDATMRDIKDFWKEVFGRAPIEPRFVKDGPVMEQVHTGADIDVLKFPAPKWHELDGGRYLGTGSISITRDRENGWVNCGTYRVMVHDGQSLGFYISPGQHGRIQRAKYFEAGESCPVAISFGHHPLFFLGGAFPIPYGASEYSFLGGILGEPVELIQAPLTGLPIPAYSEIAIEGVARPDVTRVEGPFGEWTGYYASGSRPEPVIEIQAIYHRANPIILGNPPAKPSVTMTHYQSALRSAMMERQIEAAGVPDVRGVWSHEAGGAHFFHVISIKQRYPGHARQAAGILAQCAAGARIGRYIVVVDDDIDPSDLQDVLWAISTRSDPEKSIDIIRRCWSSPLDPVIPAGMPSFSSRAVIDATRPFEWIGEFPAVVGASKEQKEIALARWRGALGL